MGLKIGRKGKECNFYKDGNSTIPKYCKCGKRVWYKAIVCRECYEKQGFLPGKSHTAEYQKLKKQAYRKDINFIKREKEQQKKFRQLHKKELCIKNKNWRIKNKEIVYLNNKNRLLKSKNIKGTHSLLEWNELKKRYNYKCAVCGISELGLKHKYNNQFQKLTKDHIIPISKNGTNDISNIRPLCVSCNSIKKDQRVYNTIFTTGSYDLFHFGHLLLLMKCKLMCKKLIVGVSSNKLIKKHKYNNPILSLKHRMKVIQALQCVDEVVIQDKLVDIKQFKRLKADLFVVGDDWINRHDVPGLEWLRENNKVVFLPYTKEVSSSIIKEQIINNADAILDAQKARKLNDK